MHSDLICWAGSRGIGKTRLWMEYNWKCFHNTLVPWAHPGIKWTKDFSLCGRGWVGLFKWNHAQKDIWASRCQRPKRLVKKAFWIFNKAIMYNKVIFSGNPLEEKHTADDTWVDNVKNRLKKLKKLDGK